MESLLEKLQKGEILLADGAMGTMLMDRGLSAGGCPEKINLDRPEILEEIAQLYLSAGSQILFTNTFGASPLKLTSYHLEDRTEEINIAAVTAVKKVAGDRAYVVASIGPCGKILKPYGDTEAETVYQSFETQIKSLVSAGIQGVCVETMMDLQEASLAIQAAKTFDLPILATMTFDQTPRGFFTTMGVSIEQAVLGLEKAGAHVIGSNCGTGVDTMIEIAGEFKKHSSLPLLIQANAGLPEFREGNLVYPDSPAYMAEKIKTLIEIGVSVIGGCCGTTPDHIQAFRQVLD